jgi:hypothetical protein
VTPPLDDVVNCCGWPLLLEANPRRLAQELSLHKPACVLFWLDDRNGLARTARLVEWSRERGSRPYRVAVAFRQEADVEAAFRAAGAHTFLPITGHSGMAMADALRPLFAEPVRAAAEVLGNSTPWITLRDSLAALEVPSELVRPP